MPEYGDLIPTGRTGSEVRVHAPVECHRGHTLRGNVVLSTATCTDTACPERSHTLWQCRTCDDITAGPAHRGRPLDPTAGGMHSMYDGQLPRGQWGPMLDLGEG